MSKRSRGESSRRQVEDVGIPRDPAFPDVIFATEEQRDRFLQLKSRPIEESRWFDMQVLEKFGILDSTGELFNSLGMSTIFEMYQNTNAQLTLEFLSSLRTDKTVKSRPLLCFRMNNVDRTLTCGQLARIFGLDMTGEIKIPTCNAASELWQRLTRLDDVNSSHLHIRMVQHPVVRLTLKMWSSSIFGRADVHSTRSHDLNILV